MIPHSLNVFFGKGASPTYVCHPFLDFLSNAELEDYEGNPYHP